MPGMGDSHSTTTQTSSTTPWAPAMGDVNGLLSNLGSLIPNTGVTAPEQGAIDKLTAAGAAGNPYAPAVGGVASSLLNGGGATSQVPQVQTNLDAYKREMAPYLDPSYSTVNSPAVKAALDTANSDVTNQVNGMFAAAGRSGSGMNTQTLARGIAQADAPIILGQANQDTATRIGAANNVYGAGNTTAGTIAGMNQTGVGNQLQGVQTANDALSANNWGAKATIAAQELGKTLPASDLGLLTQIGVPLAQLGTNSNGTSNTTNTASPLTQLGQLTSALGGTSTAANGATSASGLLGLMALL